MVTFFNNIDRSKTIELITGILGIWASFIIYGILLQYITTSAFYNISTGQRQKYLSPSGLLACQKSILWLKAVLWNKWMIPPQQKIKGQMKNIQIAGFWNFVSSYTIVQSLKFVSFPIFNIFRSASVLSSILVAVLCTKVTDKKYELKPQKVIIGVLIVIGIFIYTYFDPQSQQKYQTGSKWQIWGYVLLIIGLVADGFLADWQAKIKQQYNPNPTYMLQEVNKWSAIVAIFWAVVIGQMGPTISFAILHPLQPLLIVIGDIPCFIGLIFIFRIIKSFKQHIVPIISTTRRMFTVIISLIFFHHPTSLGQIIGIVIVFSVSIFEFILSIIKDTKNQTIKTSEQPPNNSLMEQDATQKIKQAVHVQQ